MTVLGMKCRYAPPPRKDAVPLPATMLRCARSDISRVRSISLIVWGRSSPSMRNSGGMSAKRSSICSRSASVFGM
jgi:hypothetical protein